MHGGFHSILLDEISSWVAFGLLHERSFLTKKIAVQYHKPIYVGQYVYVSGELVEDSEKIITSRGEIRDRDNALISDALSTMIRLNPEHMMRNIKKDISPGR
jgi:acyl-coenzyme A thioesterase PaaI-like protein